MQNPNVKFNDFISKSKVQRQISKVNQSQVILSTTSEIDQSVSNLQQRIDPPVIKEVRNKLQRSKTIAKPFAKQSFGNQ